jgi:hypothetical protein
MMPAGLAVAVPALEHRQRADGDRHLPPADIPPEVPLQLDTGAGSNDETAAEPSV